MSDTALVVFGVVVSFIACAGAYLVAREWLTHEMEETPRPGRPPGAA